MCVVLTDKVKLSFGANRMQPRLRYPGKESSVARSTPLGNVSQEHSLWPYMILPGPFPRRTAGSAGPQHACSFIQHFSSPDCVL